jgi:hypothetical protein
VERKSRNRGRDQKGTRQRMQKKDDAPQLTKSDKRKREVKKKLTSAKKKQSSEELKNWRRVSLVERETKSPLPPPFNPIHHE